MADTDQAAAQRAQEALKADKERQENAKKVIAEQRQAREQRMAEPSQTSAEGSKPTPTQEENDLAAMGVHIPEHEPDGSPVTDPNAPPPTGSPQSKQMAPGGRAPYQTRAATPKEEPNR